MNIEKVVCYARVSTNSEDQLNSFENQKSFFQDYLTKFENYEFAGIYADRGLSGTSLNKRVEFEKMLFDAGLDKLIARKKPVYEVNEKRKPIFNRIFVKNSSRFARNVLVTDILRELKRNKVYVNFLDLNITTENNDYEFILNFFLNFDQQESLDKSKKVKFGHLESARKGRIFTNHKLYGYNYITETNLLEIIPEEAEVIKKIFDLYASGIGIRRILNYLDENGITTRQGKKFAKTTLVKILQNEKYYGCNVRNKYTTGEIFYKHSPKVLSSNKWLIHEDMIPAIITKEIFLKCQEIRSSKVNSVNQKGIHHGTSEFAGKIKCGKCGNTYIRNIDRGKPFYNCSLKKTKGTNICNGKNLSQKNLDKFMELLMNEILPEYYVNQKEEIIEALEKSKIELLSRIDQKTEAEIESLTIELENLNNKKNRLVDLFLEGNFNKDYLDIKANEVDEQINILKDKIDDLSKSNLQIEEDIMEINRYIQSFESMKLMDKFTLSEAIDEIEEIIICDTTLIVLVKITKLLEGEKYQDNLILYNYNEDITNIDFDDKPEEEDTEQKEAFYKEYPYIINTFSKS